MSLFLSFSLTPYGFLIASLSPSLTLSFLDSPSLSIPFFFFLWPVCVARERRGKSHTTHCSAAQLSRRQRFIFSV